MNVGLGNLTQVKARLLATSVRSLTAYDTPMAQIARGVAGLIDNFCNRTFERASGGTDEFTADRALWILSRYPVETITTIEVRDGLTQGWVDQGAVNSFVEDWSTKSGLVQFGGKLGTALSRVRITYTGGYWFDTTEDGTGVMPGAATLLPYDVTEAWLLQCEAEWASRDKIGSGLATVGSEADPEKSVNQLDLVPQVKAMLAGHIRYQLT